MLFLLLLFLAPAMAQENPVCGVLNSAHDLIECVKTKAPMVKSLEEDREATLSESRASRRWLNPQLTNQTLFGKQQGQSQLELQFGFWQSIELGPRWSYKSRLSESLETRAQAEYTLGLGNELVQTGQDLLRLSQLKTEVSSHQEAIGTLSRLLSQFSNRPRLSSEQEVSQSVYQMSQADIKIRLNTLISERDQIYHRFQSKLGLGEAKLEQLATLDRLNLPPIDVRDFPEATSPEVRVVDADLSSAMAEMSLARSDVFSSIQVGPMVQLQTEGLINSQLYGFQVQIPFPLWNQNGHGVDAAARKLKSAEIKSSVRKKAVQEEWNHSVENYERLKTLLAEIPTASELEKRHKKVEGQIQRGLVSSALVIESHRSLLDLQRSRHESEMTALATLWHIYIIQGKVSEIHL